MTTILPVFAFLNLGGMELVLILAVVLLLFGAKRLPELARGLGQAVTEFKKASREGLEETAQSVAAEKKPETPGKN